MTRSRLLKILPLIVTAQACSLSTVGGFHPYDVSAPEEEGTGEDYLVEPADEDAAPADPDPQVETEDDASQEEALPEAIEDGLACVPFSAWCNPDGSLSRCNADGTGSTTDACPFGCGDTPAAHCMEFVPSNVPDASLLCVAGTLAFSPAPPIAYLLIYTESGAIDSYDLAGTPLDRVREPGSGLISGINFALLPQTDGAPDLAVFSFESFNLSDGIELFSMGPNALALFSCGDVTISGTLNAGSLQISGLDEYTYILPGPGGGDTDQGRGAGSAGSSGGSSLSGGGGGGSFGGLGGAGGTTSGGLTGMTYGDELLVPLRGGSGGGSGADNGYPQQRGWGGPSGGALQISTRGLVTITATGRIEASGWGGFGGIPGAAGGGGGSGGGILVEAHTITASPGAFITANGGGGGSGGHAGYGYTGSDGERGHESLDAAAGGASPADGACPGGNGNSAADINGGSIYCPGTNGGGGGGGAGRIRLSALELLTSPDTISPSLSATPTTATSGLPNLL